MCRRFLTIGRARSMCELAALPASIRRRIRLDDSGCWNWTGAKIVAGYGYTYVRVGGVRARIRAHRALYALLIGPIPDGTELDHLCRNRACVNPTHLEPVTHAVNVLRGDSPMAKNAQKTHCPLGHPYDAQNTYVEPRGYRRCRSCHRIESSARYQRKTA